MTHRTVLTSLALAAMLAAAAQAQPATAPAGFEAISRPSRDLTLSFTRPGGIAAVRVQEGREVKPGDVLAELDDKVERAQLEELRAQAADPTRIEAARARLEQSKVDLEKIRGARAGGGATDMEVEHARLDLKIAELSLKLAEFQQQQDARKVVEAELALDRMKLRSEIAGRVEHVFLRQGESADALQKVIRVVQIDPLWVDVSVPMAYAGRVKAAADEAARRNPAPEAMAQVRFGGKAGKPLAGVIIFKAAVADAASETLRLRIELPNPDGLPAGQRCWVTFGPPAPAAEPAVSKSN